MNLNEDTTESAQITLIDGDQNDTYTYEVTTPGLGNVVWGDDGWFDYTPPADFHGEDRFVVTVTDAQGLTDTTEVIVTVNPINDAPTALATLTLSTAEDTAVTGNVQPQDIDVGDSFTFEANPQLGTIEFASDGSFTYTPHAHVNGTDTFTITTIDSGGEQVTTNVEIAIAPVNDPLSTVPLYEFTTVDISKIENRLK